MRTLANSPTCRYTLSCLSPWVSLMDWIVLTQGYIQPFDAHL